MVRVVVVDAVVVWVMAVVVAANAALKPDTLKKKVEEMKVRQIARQDSERQVNSQSSLMPGRTVVQSYFKPPLPFSLIYLLTIYVRTPRSCSSSCLAAITE